MSPRRAPPPGTRSPAPSAINWPRAPSWSGWANNGWPLFDILKRPADATPLTVGGLPAYVEPASSVPASVRADLSFVWTLAMPGSVDNYYTVSADIRGPGTAETKAQVDALIASLRYDPPVVPLPTGAGAAEAAATKALATLAKQSASWLCFPSKPGTRQMVVDGLPVGPNLARPQLATCTTAIEATPLQLLRRASPSGSDAWIE